MMNMFNMYQENYKVVKLSVIYSFKKNISCLRSIPVYFTNIYETDTNNI